jgi:CRP-like cAMP-binding protein
MKGHFQLERVLPQKSGNKSQLASSMLERNKLTPNILQYRLPELSDFPQNHKLKIYGPGSVVGEDDVIKHRLYSATLKCISEKGTIIEIPMKCLALLLETDE